MILDKFKEFNIEQFASIKLIFFILLELKLDESKVIKEEYLLNI